MNLILIIIYKITNKYLLRTKEREFWKVYKLKENNLYKRITIFKQSRYDELYILIFFGGHVLKEKHLFYSLNLSEINGDAITRADIAGTIQFFKLFLNPVQC